MQTYPFLLFYFLFPPQEFTSYLQKHDEVLTELEKATKRVKKLETVYKEFELQKVCYLPLNTFLLKPIQRLMHYKLILERLCKHYSPEHRDHHDCKGEHIHTLHLYLLIGQTLIMVSSPSNL